ncbi:uncharacterized protein METZ01_LOCUS66499, partial [marine metagenome]
VDSLLSLNCIIHCLVRESSDLRWLPSPKIHLHLIDLAQPNFKIPDLEAV